MMVLLIKAGILGALLLGVLYAAFIIVASMQSATEQCVQAETGQLLSVLAAIILGAGGGILASITLAVACSTTAIALTTVFAQYVHAEVTQGYVSYFVSLLITLGITIFFANYGFDGIMQFLAPIVMILYPALVVLTCTNILYKVWNIDVGKIPFYVALFVACTIQLKLYTSLVGFIHAFL